MLRILIADDEPIMLKALEQIIRQSDLPFDQIITARSGRDAIEKAQQFHPDLMLTDIKMPGINGLEAIRNIKALLPDIHCIILSAFDSFEYAAEAVGLGAIEYLLKPVNEYQLLQALRSAYAQIVDTRTKLSEDLKLKESLELMRPILESGFFHALRTLDDTTEELETYSLLLNGNVMGGYAICLAFSPFETNNAASDLKRSLANQVHYANIATAITALDAHAIASVAGNRLHAFFFNDTDIPLFDQKLKAQTFCQTLLEKMATLPMRLHIGVGRSYSDLLSCKHSYLEALQALSHAQHFESQSAYLHIHDLQSISGDDLTFRSWQEDQIYSETAAGHIEQALIIFEHWLSELTLRQEPLDVVKGKAIALLVGFGRFNGVLGESFYQSLSGLLRADSLRDAQRVVQDMLQQLSLQIPKMKQKQINALIQESETYMEKHYAEDLSLEELAKAVNLSPFYFSRLYKEETGTNFITKLIEIRVERAKKYLLESDIPIKELSSLVGYPDANYFSKLFKKNTGYTPTEYKERHKK